VFGGDDVGVDAESVSEAPHVDVLMEASCFGLPMLLAKVLL
jgi:hypothetical protein